MKKLLVLLLISALAILVFAGCDGLVPSEGEGEGEGEGEVEAVTVEIDGMVELADKTWVSCGNHDITVTFAAPVENVYAWLSYCSGYYGTDTPKLPLEAYGDVVLFPNEDKTVWEGSGYFGCYDYETDGRQPLYMCSPCCATYINVEAGECEAGVCVSFPVIVDCDAPYAKIEVSTDGCVCEGCEITFESTSESQECADAEECCGDDCSGLAGWSIAVYDNDPFDICCETPCEEPIYTCSGTACPIECTTDCLKDGTYYAVVNLVDNVGNEVEYYAQIVLSSVEVEGEIVCSIAVTDYCADVQGCTCTSFDESAEIDTDNYIGFCYPDWNCCLD